MIVLRGFTAYKLLDPSFNRFHAHRVKAELKLDKKYIAIKPIGVKALLKVSGFSLMIHFKVS